MFTGWSKRGRFQVEGKTSLVLKRLVSLEPAENRERSTEVWRTANWKHWHEPSVYIKQKKC